MQKLILKTLFLSTLLIGAEAQASEFGKPISASIRLHRAEALTFRPEALPRKKIMLMNVKLTEAQKELLRQSLAQHARRRAPQMAEQAIDESLPYRYNRGMNNTPVLDQGLHGSCATFANTAAIDALLKQGDYISQLCHLSLGAHFEEKGYLPSGWDGSWSPLILNQILGFGIMNKSNQVARTCGGLKEYPIMMDNTGTAMTLSEFKESSENLSESISWESLLTFSERFDWNPENPAPGNTLLRQIKKEIAKRKKGEDSRITFGVFLPFEYCDSGACARYHNDNDTWAYTYDIQNDQFPELAGHEMVITGYDDSAEAVDNEGNKHQGLLILRNSWGEEAGDHGNFYMTYDFFKLFVAEVQKITITKD